MGRRDDEVADGENAAAVCMPVAVAAAAASVSASAPALLLPSIKTQGDSVKMRMYRDINRIYFRSGRQRKSPCASILYS